MIKEGAEVVEVTLRLQWQSEQHQWSRDHWEKKHIWKCAIHCAVRMGRDWERWSNQQLCGWLQLGHMTDVSCMKQHRAALMYEQQFETCSAFWTGYSQCTQQRFKLINTGPTVWVLTNHNWSSLSVLLQHVWADTRSSIRAPQKGFTSNMGFKYSFWMIRLECV